MSDPTPEQERARRILRLMEDIPEHTNKSLRITTYWMVGLGALAVIIAGWWILRSFDERGVAVAVAVVGGTVGVFLLALVGRLVTDAFLRASRRARDDDSSPRGRPDSRV